MAGQNICRRYITYLHLKHYSIHSKLALKSVQDIQRHTFFCRGFNDSQRPQTMDQSTGNA